MSSPPPEKRFAVRTLFSILPLALTLAAADASTTLAYLSFSGGNGTPFGITLHTPLHFEVTSPIPGGSSDLNDVFAIAFRNVGDLLTSRSVAGTVEMTVNGSPSPYYALAAAFDGAGTPLRWGIATTTANNDLVMSNEFIQFLQYYGPAALDAGIPGIGAVLSDFPLQAGATFDWSAGTMTTNSGITLRNTPEDGYYEVAVVNASGAAFPISVTAGAIPEPSSGVLLLGFAGAAAMRRRRHRAA